MKLDSTKDTTSAYYDDCAMKIRLYRTRDNNISCFMGPSSGQEEQWTNTSAAAAAAADDVDNDGGGPGD